MTNDDAIMTSSVRCVFQSYCLFAVRKYNNLFRQITMSTALKYIKSGIFFEIRGLTAIFCLFVTAFLRQPADVL